MELWKKNVELTQDTKMLALGVKMNRKKFPPISKECIMKSWMYRFETVRSILMKLREHKERFSGITEKPIELDRKRI